MYQVKQKIIDWLLEDSAQPVRYLTLVKILDQDENSTKIMEAKAKIMTYQPIHEILKNQKEKYYWFDKGKTKNYKKYLGTFWQLIFLSELQASKNEQINNAIEHIFNTGQADNGGFSISGTNTYSIICLTSNILKMLIHFGYLDDDRTQKALEYLLGNFVDTNGDMRCQTIGLVGNCYMTLPKIVHALSSIPDNRRTARINSGLNLAINRLIENHIYQYVPENNREWVKTASERKLKGKELVEVRRTYLMNHPNLKKVPKSSWLKFGFPHSYTSDVLDTMRALVNAKTPYHKNMGSSLELIKEKSMTGKWVKERKFKSPMYSEIEPYKSESKWLTLHALMVMKYYEKLSIIE